MSTGTRPLIALAIPELGSGGPDRVIFELLKGLPRARFRIALIVQQPGGRYFEQLPADVAVHVLSGGGRYPVWGLVKLVRNLAPDVLLTTLRMNVTAGLARPALGRVALIARQANAIGIDFAALKQKSFVKHRIAEQVVRFALRRADALVAQSRDMARELRHDARAGQHVATIGNPVAIDEIDRAAANQAAEGMKLPGAPSIVAVGRLMDQKGYDLLVEAMPAVLSTYPEAHLTILGEGPLRRPLEVAIAAARLGSRVSLPGQSNAVLATVRSADVVVSSSRYEGFSNAILEAMALGSVVAATDCPGATKEMIAHGETGFLCSPENAAALADCIAQAAAADRRVGRAARAFVVKNYDRRTIVDRYAALVDDVLAVAAAKRSGSPKKRASSISTDSTV